MGKIIFATLVIMCSAGVLAQTDDGPLPLEVAQQRARFVREQMLAAERKVQTADKKDKAAQSRLEEAKTKAEQTAKELRDAQSEFVKVRERHDRAYQDLKRAHDAPQGSDKQR